MSDHSNSEFGACGPFGNWQRDENDLPCFDLDADPGRAPYDPLPHLLSTGHLWARADRWGGVALSTSDGGQGYQRITQPAHQCRSAVALLLAEDGELVSCVPGECTATGPIRYGIGYVRYRFRCQLPGGLLDVEECLLAPPQGGPGLQIHFRVRNPGTDQRRLQATVQADCSLVDRYHHPLQKDCQLNNGSACLRDAIPGLGGFRLDGDRTWQGQLCSTVGIGLQRDLVLAAGEQVTWQMVVGYGDEPLARLDFFQALAAWKSELAKLEGWALEPGWMRDECQWTLGQALQFTGYDATLQEHYSSLGGYGWGGCNQREQSENAIALAAVHPRQAQANLRWAAKTQYANGDLPSRHAYSEKYLQQSAPGHPESSDTELWFILAVCEHAQYLDEELQVRDGGSASLWQRACRAWDYVWNVLGRGRHGLIHNAQGDWNDYLFPMGRDGHGESVKNTGMAARAAAGLAEMAQQRGETALADTLNSHVAELGEALQGAWCGTHYLRGYTDAGRAVGGDRVFINAQSWAALGGGESAGLQHALEHNQTELGLCLVNPAFPCPPPADISSLPISAGEGENGGVWPQAVAWFIWALAEAGMIEVAWQIWRRLSLRQHYAVHPDTPFGIWNGPDCYNSHLAKVPSWTQVALWDRRVHSPMNPSVMWQAFAAERILRTGHDRSV